MTHREWSQLEFVRSVARAFALRLALAALIAAPIAVRAQHPHSSACAPRGSVNGPAFIAGNKAGNLRRSWTKFWADGSTQVAGAARSAPDRAIADSVAVLAEFARRSRFWSRTPAPITRPTRNPDMTRHYVEAHLRCGAKRSVYPADAEPADFHELFTRLAAVAKLTSSR